jgi:hypothetical protein
MTFSRAGDTPGSFKFEGGVLLNAMQHSHRPPFSDETPRKEMSRSDLPPVDDMTFAKLAMYGGIPGNYPRLAEGAPLSWAERIISLGLWAVLLALAFSLVAYFLSPTS